MTPSDIRQHAERANASGLPLPTPRVQRTHLSLFVRDPVRSSIWYADVLGMTTYEELVDATLPHGLMPLVVPQLKTITLGGAVTGLGIESSSFRSGTPHESVLDLDVLTGDGRVMHVTPDGEHADLFAGFPNSYGTLGYALRLRIELEPVSPYVHLRHVACGSAQEAAQLLEQVEVVEVGQPRGGLVEAVPAELVDLGTDLLVEVLAAPLAEPVPQTGDVTYAEKLAPDELRLSVPKAYVALAPGFEPTEQTAFEILRYAREHLAPYQRVRRLEFYELPKTISGKIRRVDLRNREEMAAGGSAVVTEWRDDQFSELRNSVQQNAGAKLD